MCVYACARANSGPLCDVLNGFVVCWYKDRRVGCTGLAVDGSGEIDETECSGERGGTRTEKDKYRGVVNERIRRRLDIPARHGSGS